MVKCHDQKWAGESIYVSFQFLTTVHNWEKSGQDFKARSWNREPWSSSGFWIASHVLLNLDYLPRFPFHKQYQLVLSWHKLTMCPEGHLRGFIIVFTLHCLDYLSLIPIALHWFLRKLCDVWCWSLAVLPMFQPWSSTGCTRYRELQCHPIEDHGWNMGRTARDLVNKIIW